MITMVKTIYKTIDFVKENDLWYVDLPEFIESNLGVKGNLLMVAGADKFLEMNSNGNSRVTVTVSNQAFTDSRLLVNTSVGVDKEMLKNYNHPIVENGGYYKVADNNFEMWLCPTLLYVFETESYPEAIYFKFINN
jgi:hypothetical protein